MSVMNLYDGGASKFQCDKMATVSQNQASSIVWLFMWFVVFETFKIQFILIYLKDTTFLTKRTAIRLSSWCSVIKGKLLMQLENLLP